eukprot:Opistho-1_new@688
MVHGSVATVIEIAARDATHCEKVAIDTVAVLALLDNGDVRFGGLAEQRKTLLRGGRPKRLDERKRIAVDGPNRLGAPVEEVLRHTRFVKRVESAVRPEVGELHGDLDSGVRTHAERLAERLAIVLKVERLRVRVLNKVVVLRLHVVNNAHGLGSEHHLDPLGRSNRRGAGVVVNLRWEWGVTVVQAHGMVPRLVEITDNSVSIAPRVLEVDSRGVVVGDNQLNRLVEPSVATIGVQQTPGRVVDRLVRRPLVQTHHEEGRIHQLKQRRVVDRRRGRGVARSDPRQHGAPPRPQITLGGRHDADKVLRRVNALAENGAQVRGKGSLGNGGAIRGGHRHEVEVTLPEDGDVLRVGLCEKAIAADLWNAARAKELAVLRHVERSASDLVHFEHSPVYLHVETRRRLDQARRAIDHVGALRVGTEEKEGVAVDGDRPPAVQVHVVPELLNVAEWVLVPVVRVRLRQLHDDVVQLGPIARRKRLHSRLRLLKLGVIHERPHIAQVAITRFLESGHGQAGDGLRCERRLLPHGHRVHQQRLATAAEGVDSVSRGREEGRRRAREAALDLVESHRGRTAGRLPRRQGLGTERPRRHCANTTPSSHTHSHTQAAHLRRTQRYSPRNDHRGAATRDATGSALQSLNDCNFIHSPMYSALI